MREPRRRVVAAFDFDGTLTRRDTLIPFLRFVCGTSAVNRRLAYHSIPLGAAIALDRRARRSEIKEKMLRELFTGRSRDDVEAAGERFAHRLGEGSRLRPDIVSRWHWHREQGHELVIVSASLEAYLQPFARSMGGGHVLGTRLHAAADRTLTGNFDGFNCRGAEKVRRLREWGVSPAAELWAYGDSSGDRELLAAAGAPHRVSRGARCPTPPVAEGRRARQQERQVRQDQGRAHS